MDLFIEYKSAKRLVTYGKILFSSQNNNSSLLDAGQQFNGTPKANCD